MTSEKEKAYYVKLADLAMQSFIEGSNHGSYMVDYFPSLKYIPCLFSSYLKDLRVGLNVSLDSMGSWCRVQATSGDLGSVRF